MKKLLIVASAISMGFVACQKEPSATAESTGKKGGTYQIMSGGSPNKIWNEGSGDCFLPAQNCMPEHVVTPSWFDVYMDFWRKWGVVSLDEWMQMQNAAVKEFVVDPDIRDLLGSETIDQIAIGALSVRLRAQSDESGEPVKLFIGIFESEDSIEPLRVYPINVNLED